MTTRECHHGTTWSHVDGETICDACEEVAGESDIKRSQPADDYDRGADRGRGDIKKILEERLGGGG